MKNLFERLCDDVAFEIFFVAVDFFAFRIHFVGTTNYECIAYTARAYFVFVINSRHACERVRQTTQI